MTCKQIQTESCQPIKRLRDKKKKKLKILFWNRDYIRSFDDLAADTESRNYYFGDVHRFFKKFI